MKLKVLCLLAFLPTHALASGVPSAVTSVQLESDVGPDRDYNIINSPTSYGLPAYYQAPDCNGCIKTFGTAYSYVSVSNTGPSILVEVVTNKTGLTSSTAGVQGTYTYYIQANGPGSTVQLSWNASAAFSASPIDYGYADNPTANAEFAIQSVGGSSALAYAGLDFNNGTYETFGFSQGNTTARGSNYAITGQGAFIANVGETYSVTLSMFDGFLNGEGAGGFSTGGISALIDPIISISSSNTNSLAYSLAFSDGVVQSDSPKSLSPPTFPTVASVPEPSSWFLLILGFGVVGLFLRKSSSLSGVEAVIS